MSTFDRLSPALPITADGQTASAQFQAYYQNLIDTLNITVSTLQGQVSALTAAQAQLNATSTTASTALHAAVGGAQEYSTTGTATITSSSWTSVASVTFPAAVAATVTFFPSGISGAGGMSNSSFSGQCRVVQTVSGVDTVLETQAFTCTKSPPPDPNEANQTSFASTTPDTHTGLITYRLDARSTGSGTITGATFYLDVTRT